jgi:hypothetical protein
LSTFFSNFQFPSILLPEQGKLYMVGIVTDSFTERLMQVRERISAACARAHRDAESVRLLAVTKVFGPEAILDAHAV